MSIISGAVLYQYYNPTINGWYEVNLDAVKNVAQADEINAQCVSDGRLERLKALGSFTLGAGVVTGLSILSLLIIKICTLAAGVLVFPLSIIPPLYGLVTNLTGLAIGGGLGYISVKRYTKPFFQAAGKHWAYANHLFQQAHAVRLRKATL